MSELRKAIEEKFESLGRAIYHNRFKTLAIMAVLIGFMASGLPHTTFDTSTESFLHEDDPAMVKYNDFRAQFGRDEMIILAIEPPEIFSNDFFDKLTALHDDIKDTVPYLDDVTSLVNARSTRGEGDRLIVEDLLEDRPQSPAEMADLRKRVISNPLYKNLIISEDGRVTAVVIKTTSFSGFEQPEEDLDTLGELDMLSAGFEDDAPGEFVDGGADTSEEPPPRTYLTDEENSAVVKAVREVMGRHQSSDFKMAVAGSPIIIEDLKRAMQNDLRRFLVLTLLTVAGFLLILFRRVSGVIWPILVVMVSLLSTVGLMGHLGVAIKLPTQILPTFLLAVGVGDAVHILTIFYRRLAHGDSQEDAIANALGHSGLPVVLTSLTTAGGLISFVTADLAPVEELGIFGGIGVMLAMFYTIILLPALLSLFPVRVKGVITDEDADQPLDRFLAAVGDFATGHAWKVLAGAAMILAISFYGVFLNRFTHNPMAWLPDNMPIRVDTKKIDHDLRGSISMEVVVDTGKENGLYDPEILNRLDALGGSLSTFEENGLFVGKTMSVADTLKEIHQALHGNQPEFYAIPQNRALIPQEFLLFENSGSDDLEDVVDSQFQLARFTIKVNWLDAVVYGNFIEEIEQRFKKVFEDRADVTVTGLITIMSRTLKAAIHSMAESYLVAFVVITLLMILLIGHLKIGLLSMIPNLAPIIVALGIIGFTDIPLDLFTMLVGSIAIGLAVDDTIHFFHSFRRYHYQTGDVRQAVHATLQTTGRAMLFTSLVLSCGFFILMFSDMHNLKNFGFITGVAIIMALLSDYLIAPALMEVVYRGRKSKALTQ
jgi:uncharacterized protein